MFDQRFFTSRLGLSALVSITAMISFNFYALAQLPDQQAAWAPDARLTASPTAELA